MQQPLIRSLDEFERLARERLAAGDDPGRVHARLAVDEGDLICVEARPQEVAGTGPRTSCLLNGYPVRSLAVGLILAIHGAALLHAADDPRPPPSRDGQDGRP